MLPCRLLILLRALLAPPNRTMTGFPVLPITWRLCLRCVSVLINSYCSPSIEVHLALSDLFVKNEKDSLFDAIKARKKWIPFHFQENNLFQRCWMCFLRCNFTKRRHLSIYFSLWNDCSFLNEIDLRSRLQVLKDGLSAVHVPYAYGFAIILLTVLVKAATFPLTKKQVCFSRKL